jgi:site-specific recombinase XerD
MSNITRIDPGGQLPTSLAEPLNKAKEFLLDSVPENTKRAYASDWAMFKDWCDEKGVCPLPAHPASVAAFLADESAHCKPSTLRRRLASIGKMHGVNGHTNPCSAEAVKGTMKGIERQFGIAQASKAPATHEKVEKMIASCPAVTLDGLRARAILLLGYAGAFRRSELVALECADLKWAKEGVVITVRRSKTDQRGKGIVKAIPYVEGPLCAATALRVWLTAAQIDRGPVFRAFLRNGKPKDEALSDHAIAIIIKEAALRCGLDASEFSGHSLRAGHVTEARSRGVADAQTMSTTGHRRVETLDMYDRRENAFQKTSAGDVLKSR